MERSSFRIKLSLWRQGLIPSDIWLLKNLLLHFSLSTAQLNHLWLFAGSHSASWLKTNWSIRYCTKALRITKRCPILNPIFRTFKSPKLFHCFGNCLARLYSQKQTEWQKIQFYEWDWESWHTSIHQENLVVILLACDRAKLDVWTPPIWIHLLGNAEQDWEYSGSSLEMIINDIRLVSSVCFSECWRKCLLLIINLN